ncbi:MAG: serine/threonine protein kinase [Pirellulales bacterium]|nr:serine/threonine protein kinase [Pirellulales bacterium]
MATASPHDLLLCTLVRQRQLLTDAQLEAALCQWLADPPRPLIDVLGVHAKLAPEEMRRLTESLQRQITETCAEPIAARVKSLPTSIQRLLMPHVSDVALAAPTELQTLVERRRAGGVPGFAPPGRAASERFHIQQVHAQGGLGVVFVARDEEIDRTVALKQIKSAWADDDNCRARFLLEARVTGRLEHPGIVPIYALGADATGRPFYAMRLIRGESLLEVIERFHAGRATGDLARQRISELRKLLKRFVDACNAVDYAHSKGVIHRDLKPANIMVGKYGETLVVDWGLAKVIGSEEDVALTTRMVRRPGDDGGAGETVIGTTIGTPAYMSPEQAAGRNDELTPATDVYSLGATLYHMLTGALPLDSDEDMGVVMARIQRGSVARPEVRAPWLPRPLASICMKALAAGPEARYASARALADDIERWLGDEPVRAHAEGWNERTYRWIRNHRTLAALLAAGYLAATAAIVIGLVAWTYSEHVDLKNAQAPPGAGSPASP